MIIALLVHPPASPLLPPPLPRVSTATTKIPHTIEEEEALALLRYSARAREESVAQCVRQRGREREREEDDDDCGRRDSKPRPAPTAAYSLGYQPMRERVLPHKVFGGGGGRGKGDGVFFTFLPRCRSDLGLF